MITHVFVFSCDDHSHNEDDPQKQEFTATTLGGAKIAARAVGWTTHSDGRAFCPACNRRISDKRGDHAS